LIPKVTQGTLAEMVGTTRSRVNFFMNRFRNLGFIEYNGEIRVHQSLLNVVLHERVIVWFPFLSSCLISAEAAVFGRSKERFLSCRNDSTLDHKLHCAEKAV
jgi:hypothetical protein